MDDAATINDIKQRFQNLTSDLEAKKASKIELETRLKYNQDELDRYFKQLKDEFGLESVDDAVSTLDSMVEKIQATMDEVTAELDRFESSAEEV